MQPFNAPISDRKRQKYGVYESRYQKQSSMRVFDAPVGSYKRELFGDYQKRYEPQPSMRPFDAPVGDWKRELYGDYQKRYETQPSMSAFDAPVSDRKRELFGDYQKRYETQPSMSAFDSELGDYKRDLYGDYRSRNSMIKVARVASLTDDANGSNWVDMTWDLPWFAIINPDFDISIYQYSATIGGSWAGIPVWRMRINGKHAYPFPEVSSSYLNTTGNKVSLGSISVKLRMGDDISMQFRSTSAADGAGDTLYMYLYYVTWEQY